MIKIHWPSASKEAKREAVKQLSPEMIEDIKRLKESLSSMDAEVEYIEIEDDHDNIT